MKRRRGPGEAYKPAPKKRLPVFIFKCGVCGEQIKKGSRYIIAVGILMHRKCITGEKK